MPRKAKVAYKTKETDIRIEINLDGSGKNDIKTPVPFLSHMLANFSKHGLIDLKVAATGDVEVDLHHTVEDTGLRIGEAIKKALGSAGGITRCGSATVPMMDSLATVVVDLSMRPYLKFSVAGDAARIESKVVYASEGVRVFDLGLAKEFLKALSNSSGADLHVRIDYADDIHHAIEAVFKALGRAMRQATSKDSRIKGVLSTKGKL